MLLCYMVVERAGNFSHQLCLVPDKADSLSKPIIVDELTPTTAAVFRVGAEEVLTVSYDREDLLLAGLEPAIIYLTPNLSAFPGMKAKYVKITRSSGGQHRTFYSKDKNKWEEWVANRERT